MGERSVPGNHDADIRQVCVLLEATNTSYSAYVLVVMICFWRGARFIDRLIGLGVELSSRMLQDMLLAPRKIWTSVGAH